jgi:beta-galactosidase GanA
VRGRSDEVVVKGIRACERQRVVCEDYPEETRSLEKALTDLAFARDVGAKVLRVSFGWDAMEPERGVYDWSFWDDFVRLATEGLRLIPYVC